ncbi:MAG: hypothetical protein H6858_00900 [Rhodospirillales bacterium]|nr:hypothetical protein [Rhodospirillales bacterium]
MPFVNERRVPIYEDGKLISFAGRTIDYERNIVLTHGGMAVGPYAVSPTRMNPGSKNFILPGRTSASGLK